jgi:hypothetical protein
MGHGINLKDKLGGDSRASSGHLKKGVCNAS